MAKRRYRRSGKAKGTQANDPLFVILVLLGLAVVLFFVFSHLTQVINSVLWISSVLLAGYALYLYAGYVWRSYLADKHNWAVRTLEYMQTMDWREFEWFVGWLYEKQGYWVTVTKASQDGGVDVELYNDILRHNLYGIVQCKQYKSGYPVSVKDVRELYGSHTERLQYYAVVTTSDFSQFAYDEVKQKSLPVELINGEALLHMVRKVGSKEAFA